MGVGKGCALPALRTVRAVLPHTALQSLVSSSGVSRLRMGRAKGEQPVSREESIGPALMVGFAASDAGVLFLLTQDGAQPSADKAVEDVEQSWCGLLEIPKPAPQYRVEIIDDPLEAVASAAARQAPHFVLERLQALFAHQLATRLEPVAKEFETLPRLAAVARPVSCLGGGSSRWP